MPSLRVVAEDAWRQLDPVHSTPGVSMLTLTEAETELGTAFPPHAMVRVSS